MLFLANLAGFAASHKKWLVIIGLLIVLVVALAVQKSCERKPKLDEKQIQKAQNAIAEQDAQKMREVLIESDVKEAVADNTVTEAKANTVNAIAESKNRWANANVSDMQVELERRAK